MKQFKSTALSCWSLIPGPLSFEEPLYSTTQYDIVIYKSAIVARELLEITGVNLLHAAEPTWWEWRALWHGESGTIVFEMTLFEGILTEQSREHSYFGGLGLQADCAYADLLAIWEMLRVGLPALWLHSPDCEILTPARFRGKMGD